MRKNRHKGIFFLNTRTAAVAVMAFISGPMYSSNATKLTFLKLLDFFFVSLFAELHEWRRLSQKSIYFFVILQLPVYLLKHSNMRYKKSFNKKTIICNLIWIKAVHKIYTDLYWTKILHKAIITLKYLID